MNINNNRRCIWRSDIDIWIKATSVIKNWKHFKIFVDCWLLMQRSHLLSPFQSEIKYIRKEIIYIKMAEVAEIKLFGKW